MMQPTTEPQFLNSLIETARAAGWIPFHVVDAGNNRQRHALTRQAQADGNEELARAISRAGHARVTAVGFPDLILRHAQHGLLVAELKSDDPKSRPFPEQWDWLLAFASCLTPPDNPYAASRAHLWRPADWPAIDTQLGLYDTPGYCRCPVCSGDPPPLGPTPDRRRQRSARDPRN